MFDPSNVALLMTKLFLDEVYTKFRLQRYNMEGMFNPTIS